MIALGVDPGIQNTGYVVLRGKKVLSHGVITPPANLKTLSQILPHILTHLLLDIMEYPIGVAGVEEVVWQGRRRRTMFPLAHVAGAIVAEVFNWGLPVYLLTPSMKGRTPLSKTLQKKLKTQHERDAFALAHVALRAEIAFDAQSATTSSTKTKPSAVSLRRLCAGDNAPG